MNSLAPVDHIPSSSSVEIGLEPDGAGTAAESARRLLFFGEALNAAIAYGGLDQDLQTSPEALFDCLESAYDPCFTKGSGYSKEDFALFFLSCAHDLLEAEQARRVLRHGAVRYLAEKRGQLSRDLAALGDELSPAQATASVPDPDEAGQVPPMPAAGSGDQQGFVAAYDSLKARLAAGADPEPYPLPGPGTPAKAPVATPGRGELARLRARRHMAVATLQRLERRRKARALALLAASCGTALAVATMLVAR